MNIFEENQDSLTTASVPLNNGDNHLSNAYGLLPNPLTLKQRGASLYNSEVGRDLGQVSDKVSAPESLANASIANWLLQGQQRGGLPSEGDTTNGTLRRDSITGMVAGEILTAQAAVQTAQDILKNFAASPDFSTKIGVAFGDSFNVAGADAIAQAWSVGDSSSFPTIEIRSSAEINGALGAFAAATDTIYLSREWVNQGNVDAVASVFLEEYGHYIDSQINTSDAPGDEGEIFSYVVRGEEIEKSKLQQIKDEHDTETIILGGQLIQIEQATVSDSGGFEGSQKTIEFGSKDGKGGGTVQYSYEFFQIPDNLIIRYEGKEIVNTGFVSGSTTQRINVPKGNSDQLEVILATNDENTQWNYKIDTTPCPDPIPFEVEAVSGQREDKDGKCIINGTINIGRKGFGKMLKVDGRVEYDDKTISVDGTVTSLIGAGSVTIDPLFQGKFDLNVISGTASSIQETGKLPNEYKLGGLEVDFSSITLNPNGIALGASFKLVEELGLPDYVFSGSDALLIRQNDVEFGSSIKASLPNFKFKDIKLFNFLQIKEFSNFSIEYIAPEDKIKIQGKLNIDFSSKPRTGEVVADLSGDNFIQIQGGKADVKGSLTVETDLKFPPKGWGLREVRLNIDTKNKDVGGGAKLTLPFGRTIKVDGELGFKLPIPPLELDKVSLNVDNLNLPIPGYPLVFFQGFRGAVENFAESEPKPIEGSLGVSATLGPQILGISAIRFDADGKLTPEQFSGTGTVTIINDKVAKAQSTQTLNWNQKFYETKGNFSILDGLIQTNSGFKVDTGFNINMSGGASVNIPKSVPFVGGAQVSSGNFLFNFSNNGSLSDDFAAGWTTVNVQKLGLELNFVAGFKGFFDGRIETIGAKNIPPTNSFIVAPGTEWIIMGADWENSNANAPVQVKAPNGNIFNESDFAATGKIAIVDELSDLTSRVVIVRDPEPGVWDINVADPTGLGNVQYSAFRDSAAPTIQITDPATDVSGGNVAINYNTFDADSSAKVSLFYDTDNQGFDGILITDNLAEADGAGSFVWNTQGVPTGDYYVYAMVMDENNAPVLTYSPGRVRVTEAADLSVTKIANADPVIVGNNLTYIITVTNNGSNNARGVTLTDTLPEGATFVSASINPTQQSDNNLIFDLGDIANGASKTIDIIITPPTSGTITNTASVTSKTFDPEVANDTAILATTVNTPTVEVASTDLAVTTTNTPAPVNLGDKLTYNLTVTNNSPTKATGVKLTSILPSGLKDISIASSKGSASENNEVVTANLGELNSGEIVTIAINATSIASGNLINTANITSNETDSNTTNNFTTQTITVNPVNPAPVDLELTKTVNNPNPNVGNQIIFTLTLTNKGPGVASGVKVTDILPPGLSFVSADSIQGTYDSNTGVWDVGNMKDNLSRTLNIVARVDNGGSFTTTAAVTAVSESDPDSTPNNNNPNEDDQTSVTINTIGGKGSLTLVFDESYYLALYPDVKQDVDKGKWRNGWRHFLNFGQKEGRDFRVLLFDQDYYLAQNADVKQSLNGRKKIKSVLDHFIKFGQFEGRQPNAFDASSFRLAFDETYYLEQNPDVKKAVQKRKFRTGFDHFIKYGQFEGRKPSLLDNILSQL